MEIGLLLYLLGIALTIAVMYVFIRGFKFFMGMFLLGILVVGYYNWLVAILMFKVWWTMAVIGAFVWFIGLIVKKLS